MVFSSDLFLFASLLYVGILIIHTRQFTRTVEEAALTWKEYYILIKYKDKWSTAKEANVYFKQAQWAAIGVTACLVVVNFIVFSGLIISLIATGMYASNNIWNVFCLFGIVVSLLSMLIALKNNLIYLPRENIIIGRRRQVLITLERVLYAVCALFIWVYIVFK